MRSAIRNSATPALLSAVSTYQNRINEQPALSFATTLDSRNAINGDGLDCTAPQNDTSQLFILTPTSDTISVNA